MWFIWIAIDSKFPLQLQDVSAKLQSTTQKKIIKKNESRTLQVYNSKICTVENVLSMKIFSISLNLNGCGLNTT